MLSDKEATGARDILKRLSREELLSLAKTVTKNQITVEHRKDAMNAIVTYTENPAELLRRRKMRREILFQYLKDSGVVISVTAEKYQVIQAILQLWGSKSVSKTYLTQDDDDPSPRQGDTAPGQFALPSTSGQFRVTNVNVNSNNGSGTPDSVAVSDYAYDASLVTTETDRQVAMAFAKWFYPLLNACNPHWTSPSPLDDVFGPQHFYAECRLSVLTNVSGERTNDDFVGSELVAARLSAITRDELLLLNANVTPGGVRGLSNPHGLLVVMACGTVHRAGGEMIGCFEQQFGLVRDPTTPDNRWKIQAMRLRIASAAAIGDACRAGNTLEATRQLLALQ